MSPHLSLIRTFSQNWHWDILNCRLALTSFKFNWIQIWSLAFIQDFQQQNTYIVLLNFFSFLFWLIPFHGGTFGSNYFLGELLCSDFTLPRACNLSPHYAQNVQIWNGPYIQAFKSQNSLSVHASPGFNQHVFGSQMKLNFEGNSDWVSGESNKVVTILLSFAIRESVDYWFCNQNFPFTSRLILSDSDSVCLAGSFWTDISHLLQCLQLPTNNKDQNDEDGQDYDPWKKLVWDLSCYDLQHFM